MESRDSTMKEIGIKNSRIDVLMISSIILVQLTQGIQLRVYLSLMYSMKKSRLVPTVVLVFVLSSSNPHRIEIFLTSQYSVIFH